MKNKQDKKSIRTYLVTISVLSFVLTLLVLELTMFILFQVSDDRSVDVYVIMLYVIPAFSVVLTCALIYFNHRTLTISDTLIDGLNKIADGNYNVTLPYKKLDRYNAVFANFNKMAAELRSVKTLREDFIHDFSHEFKTPIASINGFANLLLDGGLSEEEKSEIIKIIADESARLSRLSESTLIMSKVENQHFTGEKKEYRLDLQLKECVIVMERQWAEKDITITSELAPVTFTGDSNLVQQVWLNLLSNAIKFTPRGGEISVKLYSEGGRAAVEIADNGVGIPEDVLPKIFDKYFQGSPDKEGNGLGLAICKRIVALSGGEISAKSKAGEGSCFKVVL